jgi:predicted component of type VI protein secretion system
MIKFDKLSTDAAQSQREDLPDKIIELEDLLQAAKDQQVAPCLQTLKDHQLKHMQLVIDTLHAFLDGADKKTLDDMIQQARDEHDAYALELARLLKLDIATVTPTP